MSSADAPQAPRENWWAKLWRRPATPWLLGIPLGAFVALLVGAGGIVTFVGAIELSSTETFCVSCHEMRDNVFQEYKKTIHYSNRTGVRATCPDCHVPAPWGPKLIRKMGATFRELPRHFLGELDTKEKFEANRSRMAQEVWDAMKGNNSRECRNCHAMEHMNLEVQDKSAARKHKKVLDEGKNVSCIECHQGIAHHLPDVAEGERRSDKPKD